MNRRGFALIAVLWLLAALSLLAGGSLAAARSGLTASRNRILLAREAWAREACVEILLGRYAKAAAEAPLSRKLAGLDSVDLGRGTWCSAKLEDPSTRINLNLADPATISTLLRNDSLADALLDWRDPDDVPRRLGAEASWYRSQHRLQPRNGPLASLDELRLVRGFDSLTVIHLATLLTVRGNGAVNPNTASIPVLRAMLDLPEDAVASLNQSRSRGHPIGSLDELLGMLSAPSRTLLASRYQELLQRLRFSPAELTALVTGRVGGSPLRANLVMTLVPLPDRLAVIRRETE
jgi:general secretion pathway protein K